MFQLKYLLFIVTPVVCALVWAGGWFWFANKLRADIDAFATEQRANGLVLDWSELRVSGFPIRFDTRFRSPAARWATSERNITWTGADTIMRPFVEGSGVVSFRAPGTHLIGIVEKGSELRIETRSDDLEGRLSFDRNGRMDSLRGRAEPLDIAVNGGPGVNIATAAFDWARGNGQKSSDEIHPDPVGDTLSVILNQINLTNLPMDRAVSATLGTTIRKFAGQIDLRGPLEPESVSPESIARWRDAGGTLEVKSLALDWGPLRIAGNGTLTVDQALQPVGAFAARILGLDILIDLFEQRGQIRPRQAAIARIALAVLTRTPADGGPPEAQMPVTIQDQTLSIGPVPLLRFAPVVWN